MYLNFTEKAAQKKGGGTIFERYFYSMEQAFKIIKILFCDNWRVTRSFEKNNIGSSLVPLPGLSSWWYLGKL